MTCSLVNHPLGYHLSNKDIALSALSALTLTAIPFAKRHCEMAQAQPQNYLGHTVLCIAECIPVIGIIVALIEYAVSAIFHHMRHNLSHKPQSIRHIAPLSLSPELPDPCRRISPGFEHKNTTFPSPEPIIAPTVLSPSTAPAKIYNDPCELLGDADNFFSTYAFPDPLTFPEINPKGLTSENLLTQLLGKYQGICIGETHQHSSSKYFLTVNMPLFKKLGVDTLYLEGYDGMQDELDAYFAGTSIDLPATLTAFINTFSPQRFGFYTEHDVIKAAKQAGIRMVNIDSQGACDVPNEGVKRVAAMNFQAKLIIDQDRAAHPGGKSIIYAGASHTNRTAGTPSLGQIYRFPAITMRDRWFSSFFGATADTVPFYTIEKEVAEKDLGDRRERNHDFIIQMDKPFK